MKINTFVILTFPFITTIFSFSAFDQKHVNIWPAIKGNWFFVHENANDFTTTFCRKGPYSRSIGFISTDTCFMVRIKSNDSYEKFKYKWKYSTDTIRIFRQRDTLIFKVQYLSRNELRIKPVL